ncbi:sigma-54 interaction domain-containing protein [Planctomycetota bacterium]
MSDIESLLDQDEFLKTMFNAIPCGVLVVNSDRRVQTVNNVLEKTFGLDRARVRDKRGGEALSCIHANDNAEGCGYGEFCQLCDVRNTALEALGGNTIHRKRAEIELMIDGQPNERTMLVSSAPLSYEGENLAIILLEDITELSALRRRLKTEFSFRGIIGRNEKMQELFETIRELADVDVPVLVQGETGTGKELVASAIHHEGPRVEKLFVPVNCGALPENLLESELFGHVKGAFTGAIRNKKGRFELADQGTIFLDEIGDITPAMQVKILRVLQEGVFEPVGSEKSLQVNVRIISATNKNLLREIARGTFRKDLYYRLCVVPLDLPPLRERKSDIPLLCEHFIGRTLEESGRESVALAPRTLDILMSYSWPGNIRELQNWLQYALVKCRGTVIEPQHLPPEYKNLVFESRQKRKRKLDLNSVRQALAETNGNKVKAAKVLGVGRATLYRFLNEFEQSTE